MAVYVGVFGESHRGRDQVERRFQNPDKNRPLLPDENRLPVLLGLAPGEDVAADVLVGYEAQRRLGRSTRYSLFAPIDLLEEAQGEGWKEHVTTSGERIIAFRPGELDRYCAYRLDTGDGEPTEGGSEMKSDSRPVTEADLESLAALIGESVEGLMERTAEKLGVSGGEALDDPLQLLRDLAAARGLEQDLEALTVADALAALGDLDPRPKLMLEVWKQIGVAQEVPLSHHELVARLYEDENLVGREAPDGDLKDLVLAVFQTCDGDAEDEDLEVFFEQDLPTPFFYENVLSHLNSLEAVRETDEEAGEEEEVAEPADEEYEPVKARVEQYLVKTFFEYVDGGELNISPPWQRSDVWPLKKKRELIRSLLLGIPLPSIILHIQNDRMSVIDGKQRLTAIVQFMRNEWNLPRYRVSEGHALYACRGAYYRKEGKTSLPANMRRALETRNIPVLLFEDVKESRLRSIFHLYNVSGTRLNAAEIRNAVYQTNPIHHVIFRLGGEGDGGRNETERAFTERFLGAYPQGKNRYQAVDFLARYLGYSRAAQKEDSNSGAFSPPSTSGAINNFFDYQSDAESPEGVAEEIVSVFDAAEDFLTISDDRLAFFLRNPSGKESFNKLIATSSMVAARFLLAAIDAGLSSEDEARQACEAVVVPYPDNQQRATIWDYQAQVLLGLKEHLGIDPKDLGPEWERFFQKMAFCRLPPRSYEAL